MCVILACVDNKPTEDIIKDCHYKNSDGISISWFEKDDQSKSQVKYKKGLYPFEATNLIQKIELPFVMHFRAASPNMPKIPSLCHPFVISEDSKLELNGSADRVLVHNGTITGWRWLLAAAGIDEPKDSMSDTRAFALILDKLKDKNKQDKFLKTIEGKFIILDSTYAKEGMLGTFRMFGIFVEDYNIEGIKFSNLDWQKKFETKTFSSFKEKDFDYFNGSYDDLNKKFPLKVSKNSIPPVNLTPEEKRIYDIHLALDEEAQDNKDNKAINVDIKDAFITCKFCYRDLTGNRIHHLRVVGYKNDEMACLFCTQQHSYLPERLKQNMVLEPSDI